MTPSGRKPITDVVTTTLRKRILNGEYAPGARIRLEETSRQLGVSNTPVREALMRLEAEDLVELLPYRGFVVARLSREDVEDMLWIQTEIYQRLIDRCLDRITAAQLTRLEELNNAEAAQPITWERSFHEALIHVADSRKLTNLLAYANKYTPFTIYVDSSEWVARSRQLHQRLIDALENGDRDEARASIAEEYEGAHRYLTRGANTTRHT
ncbi:GntR family transcriptional regulator [Antrihabitans spumae]|uniref:GntR family transcriptional regulator n=1 Tax=Antrihabitans spumae TaxID=3373370 RepID=A0ABW7JME4_9NOCA